MVGKKIEKRRIFTPEERKTILKKNYGICACCGKKLTTKTLRVEHVIPLSRGGTNSMENLTALCEACNEMKGNLLYMPHGFYAALRDRPRFTELSHYVWDWFQNVKEDFDLERFPLISPQFIVQLDLAGSAGFAGNRKLARFVPQLAFKWSFVGRDSTAETEAVTGLSIENIRHEARTMMEHSENGKHPIATYCLKKVSTDQLLMLVSVNYSKEEGTFIAYVPWHCMPKRYAQCAMLNFIYNLLTSLEKIAGNYIRSYGIASYYKELENIFSAWGGSVPEFLMRQCSITEYEDLEENRPFYACDVSRMPDIPKEEISREFKKLKGDA